MLLEFYINNFQLSLIKKTQFIARTTVALKVHHYINLSLHYTNFDLCEKTYVIMYT